jgi:hypothetical protein
MDERTKESISALMDDEANEIELQRLLSKEDPEALLDTWQRYHRMREAVNGHEGLNIQVDISAAVRSEIERDEMPFDDTEGSLAYDGHRVSEGRETAALGSEQHSDQSSSHNLVGLSLAGDGIQTSSTAQTLSSYATVVEPVRFDKNESAKEDGLSVGAKSQTLKYSSFALAACLMLAVFLNLSFESPVEGDQYASTDGLVVNVLTGAESANFNEYLLRHSERSTVRANYSMAPLVRVASVNSVGI